MQCMASRKSVSGLFDDHACREAAKGQPWTQSSPRVHLEAFLQIYDHSPSLSLSLCMIHDTFEGYCREQVSHHTPACTLADQYLLFATVPTKSRIGFVLKTYEKVGHGSLRYGH